jgi:hypothetical protein
MLNIGDKVKVTVPHLCRFNGTVKLVTSLAVMVERDDDGSWMSHKPENVVLLEDQG